ncbi:hypothetical protein KY348_04645 [Candidatus Woesearchaeota archaeon]|nr:hypothetical protein [Candidatus Woesearchaeota archaeon]
MIIRQPEKNLVDSVRAIEESDRFAFLIKPAKIILPGKGVIIDHLDMRGPSREQAYHTKKDVPGKYNGPTWQSHIQIYPDEQFDGLLRASSYFITEVVGKPSSTVKDYGKAHVIQYHFDKNLQPPRKDFEVRVVPHIVNFYVNTPEKTAKQRENEKATLQFGKLGDDLTERIFFPPRPYDQWHLMPATTKKLQEQIDKENYETFPPEE